MLGRRMGAVGRGCGAALLAVVLALTGLGCQYMFPSSLLVPGYLVNRDGHYYVGARCLGNFIFAQANWSDETADGRQWPDYPPPFWEVNIDPPGVREILLFEEGQPGAHTVINGHPGTTSRAILFSMVRPGQADPISGGFMTYGSLQPGQVDGGMGVMSWDDFAKIPDGDFGWC